MNLIRYSTFEECKSIWENAENNNFCYPFQSWWYLNLFFQHFSKGNTIFLLGVFENKSLLALGAFEKVNKTIIFLGTKDVSLTKGLVQDITDFGDLFFTKEGTKKSNEIWQNLITYFSKQDLKLQLDYVRQDSPTYEVLMPKSEAHQDETSPYITLPASWDDYLSSLEKKTTS